ncbi:MAG TPA: hypothetical protein VF618_26215 [Thermoanaerobaculia bacterium]
MKRLEVEVWVLRVMNAVVRRGPTEDQLVELKREWPTDFNKVARRIAGHANSARFQPIMWLIGVDEKAHTVPGAPAMDVASWIAQVRAEFAEEWAPPVDIYNFEMEGRTVTALLFNTEGAPFLVKAGAARFDVPWRDTTATRSARRSELLSLLSEPLYFPEFEVLRVSVYAEVDVSKTYLDWVVDLQLYITQTANRPVYFPFHRMHGWLQKTDGSDRVDLDDFGKTRRISGIGWFGSRPTESRLKEVVADDVQISVYGPGRTAISASCREDAREVDTDDRDLTITLMPAMSGGAAVVLQPRLKYFPAKENLFAWKYFPSG